MLKEVFLIGKGVLLFHYSSDPLKTNSDDVILSSGLFSAINDFSKSTRSDTLESFSTENEYFLFMRFLNTEKTLVGVFERATPEKFSREVLKKIHDVIANAELPEEDALVDLSLPEKENLKLILSNLLIQLFGTREEAAYLEEILGQRTDIPLAFLLDINEKKLIAKFARPKPLFREQQVEDYFLFFETLRAALSQLGIPNSYVYFIVKSNEYVTASVYSGKISSIATGAMNTSESDVISVALNMRHYKSLEELIGHPNNAIILNRSILQANGNIIHKEGESLQYKISIFLLTLINNLNGLFRLLTRRNFNYFEVMVSGAYLSQLKIERRGSGEDFDILLNKY